MTRSACPTASWWNVSSPSRRLERQRRRACNPGASHAVRNGVDLTRQHEEHTLFSRLRGREDPAGRERAVRRYLPLARSLANRYQYSGEPMEDLEQVASL